MNSWIHSNIQDKENAMTSQTTEEDDLSELDKLVRGKRLFSLGPNEH